MAENFVNARVVLGTGASDVYTCPSGTTAVVIGAQVANVDNANTCDLRFWWTDASNTNAVTHLGYDITVPPRSAYEPISGKLVLSAGDKIRGQASAASDLEVTVSLLELS